MRHGPLLATLAVLAVGACSPSQDSGSGSASAPAAAAAPALSDAEKQAILASYPAPYNTADLANGEAKFALCRSCHTIVPGGANMTGPNLHGVFGKKAAANPDYKYSEALKASNITWDAAQLDQWLANPKTFVPGNKMTFAGLNDAKDRVDLIGWLMVETGHKAQ